MSKQFRFYLLPSDIEHVVAELRAQFDVRIIETVSDVTSPIEIDSPIRRSKSIKRPQGFSSVYCYLIPCTGAEIKMWYMTERKMWCVKDCSEVIQFAGCEYDGAVLEIGRFYYQTDMLIGDSIWPKRREFIEWADKVFRTTKRMLARSAALNAYVGPAAAKWEKEGGQFVS
jgi:hypothetical protein